MYNTNCLKKSELNEAKGQFVFTKYAGIQPGTHYNAPIVIKAPYATVNSARAQIGFENQGSNAATLWLALDGSLKLTLNTGQTVELIKKRYFLSYEPQIAVLLYHLRSLNESLRQE